MGPAYETAGIIIGGVAFVAIAFALYRWILRMASVRSTHLLQGYSGQA